MKSLIHIAKAIYQTPWMVLPRTHEVIRRQFERHMESGAQLPDMPMEHPEDDKEDKAEFESVVSNIATISVDGIIGKHLGLIELMCGGVDVDEISELIDTVAENPDVTDVLFYFHTPGITVTGVPERAQKIATLGETKRTWAYVDQLCASAGYYLASQVSAGIYATPSAELGSVGVYALYLDESGALENAHYKVNAISAGKYKLTGASFRPMSDEERTMLQADVDKIYNKFKATVTSKRNIADEDLQGQVFDGEDSIAKGFADGNVNSLHEMLSLVLGQQQ